jgi:hypothetical protein
VERCSGGLTCSASRPRPRCAAVGVNLTMPSGLVQVAFRPTWYDNVSREPNPEPADRLR